MDALTRLAKPQVSAKAAPAALPSLSDDFDDFLELFEELHGLVPQSFFLLFKIARVIKTPEAALNGQLRGFFDICESAERTAPTDRPDKQHLTDEVPILTDHEPHFGTRKIKGLEEIGLARPGDVAEEDFTDLLRRAEERQLNVRVLVRSGAGEAAPETAPITDRGTRSMANAAEQKLYVLLDRSYSMRHRNRLLYAKVLAIEYLRRKKKSNAKLFFRPFDFDVYELESLTSPEEYDALIRRLLFIEPGGKGTDIAHALEVAANDIRFDGMFDGAEILVITDGMDRVDPDELRQRIGEKIVVHMLKIGRDEADPQDAEIKEIIEKDQLVGLSREEVIHLFRQRITQAWDKITETLLETDDLDGRDLGLGEPEVTFALEAVERITAQPVAGLTLADAEIAFRKASFVEGFIDLLLSRAEDDKTIGSRSAELSAAQDRLHEFKVAIAAKSGITASLLAGKDLRFINDKSLRRQAKKAKMTLEDLGRLQEQQDLLLQLKLGGGKAKPGEGGMSLWQLLRLVGRATVKSVTGWLFSDKDETEEPPPESPEPKPSTEDNVD
ncbi:MAG: VWA domain-containing protein [Candidatus Lernaella stagnicola]|nr:VWA domain-containing protein [Candidatus Lernaella stagnicola]